MINNKSTLESRIAQLEKMLKNNFKYRVNEDFDDDDFDAIEIEEVKKEVALFEEVIANLKAAKLNLDKLTDLKWDQYGTDEDNSYYSNMSDKCSKMIKDLSTSVRNLKSVYPNIY